MLKLEMKTTAMVTTVLVICLGVYDLICVSLGSTTVSVSAFFVNAGIDRPMVIFTIGFICGHLYGPLTPRKDQK